MKDNDTCRVFLCYRGYDKSTDIAAAFKKYSESKWNELAAKYCINAKLECHYSGSKVVGNYNCDIHKLLDKSDYMIIFADKNITAGFIDADGNVNRDCITAKEFCEAEKLRQVGELNLILLNIDGYSFNNNDRQNLENLFAKNNVLCRDSISGWMNLNTNRYHSDIQNDSFNRILNGILENISKTSINIEPQKEIAACSTDFKTVLEDYFREQFCDNMYLRLDDIPAGDGNSVKQVQIEDTFIDLSAVCSKHAYGSKFEQLEEDEFDFFSDEFQKSSLFVETILSLENETQNIDKKKNSSVDDIKAISLSALSSESSYELSHANQRNFILLGRAGQGKTTLIQYIALVNWASWIKKAKGQFNYGERFLDRLDRDLVKFCPRVTFKVALAIYDKYVSYICEQNKNEELLGFDRYIEYLIWCFQNDKKPFGTKSNDDEREALNQWLSICSNNEMQKDIQSMLKSMPMLILFDGLDEVKFNRQKVVDQIKIFVDVYTNQKGSNIITITTTRKEKAEELRDRERFTDYELTNLNGEEVKKFVDKYICAKWRQNSSDKISDVMRYYEQDEYRKLMQTPLEVAMICMVYISENKMPDSIINLYETYVKMYIQHERQKQYTEKEKTRESKDFFGRSYTDQFINDFLNAVAFELEYNSNGVTEKRALEIAKNVNMDDDNEPKRDIDDQDYYFKTLVDIVFTRLSFFDIDNSNPISIYSLDNHHASVREYLAARYCVIHRSDDDILHYAQQVLIEQEISPQHWGIFRFLLELIIDKNKLVKRLLQKLLDDCINDVDKDDEIKIALKNTRFGAQIASKLICEEHIFNSLTNYKKSLLQGALEIFMLESVVDFETLKSIINFAQDNNLMNEVYLAIEAKLTDDFVSDNLTEAVAFIAVNDMQIDRETYPNLFELLESGDYLNLVFRRLYDATCFNNFKNSLLKNYNYFCNLFDKLVKLKMQIDISLDSEHPMVCNNREFFCVIEFIRRLFLERSFFENIFSEELYNTYFNIDRNSKPVGRKIWRLFDSDPIWVIKHGFDQITISTISHKCKTTKRNEQLLRFYFSVYDKESDMSAIDSLMMLCEKHGLAGMVAMLKCIKDFNEVNFENFTNALIAGKWDDEFFAIFGKYSRWRYMDSLSDITVHPAFITVVRYLNNKHKLKNQKICKQLLFDILKNKIKLTATEALEAVDKGLACRITMPNVSNSKHVKLFDEVGRTSESLLPFIFSGLEWKNRFISPISNQDESARLNGTYECAVKDESYKILKPRLIALLNEPQECEYYIISVLNFLLADPQCSIKELTKYLSFDIGQYSMAIKQQLFYRYSNYNMSIMTTRQYNIPQDLSDTLFHGGTDYKRIITNLIKLALDSDDYLLYFKQALCMILNSQDFILNLDISGLIRKYNNDEFLLMLKAIKKWRNYQEVNSPSFKSICTMIANYIVKCTVTNMFELPQETYTVIIRFILNNFGLYSGTAELMEELLSKIPSNGEFSSVRKEIQDYFAMLLKHNKVQMK